MAKREQMSPTNLQAAIQEEQNRLYLFLHDQMSPKLMGMAFFVESFAARLRVQLEAAKEAARSDGFSMMYLTKCTFYSIRLRCDKIRSSIGRP
jgi:hypothetical protein